jgi:putative endonuclease
LRAKGEAISSMEKNYYIYIMTNKLNSVLYTGITKDLKKRCYEHKNKLVEGFTKNYNISKLIYYEIFKDVEHAIMREKQIKGGSRVKKIELVNKMNPKWRDLYNEL